MAVDISGLTKMHPSVVNPINGFMPRPGQWVRLVGAVHPLRWGRAAEVVGVTSDEDGWWMETRHEHPVWGVVYSGGVLGGVEPILTGVDPKTLKLTAPETVDYRPDAIAGWDIIANWTALHEAQQKKPGAKPCLRGDHEDNRTSQAYNRIQEADRTQANALKLQWFEQFALPLMEIVEGYEERAMERDEYDDR